MKYLLEGKISVKAALSSPYREVLNIQIDKNKKDRDTSYILKQAKQNNIEVSFVEREHIDALCDGKTHGGVIAYASERRFQTINDIQTKTPFLAIVEGVEDPFNFGFVLRSLYAAGVDAIILTPRNWTSAATTLAKSSAGASELLPMIIAEDMNEMIKQLKQNNIQIVCANRNQDSIEMYNYNFNQSVCICIGGEKRGLSKVILNESDQDVYIPYMNDFKNALSAASASTILAYEVLRQRKN